VRLLRVRLRSLLSRLNVTEMSINKAGVNPSKPKGFNLLTRIVFVHAAFSLTLLLSALMHSLARGSQPGALFAALGILLAALGCWAMFVVVKRRSRTALAWLRSLLWITVVKLPLGLLPVFASDGAALTAVHGILLNEAVLVPLALYWSRPCHARYLASLTHP